MKISIQTKGAESSPIVIDTNARSTENTTLTFPSLNSKDTLQAKAFSNMQIAMKSGIITTLISEIKGWMNRQSKYKFASKKEAMENKQSVLNKFFTYDRRLAADKSRKIEWVIKNDIPLMLCTIGYNQFDYVHVVCPVINTKNDKVIFKLCGHFWINSAGEMTDASYESYIEANESYILNKIFNS